MYTTGYPTTVPPMVSIFTKGVGWITEDISQAQPTSASWGSANRAQYFPIILPAGCVARRVWWANGATTSGGATIEVGLYANGDYKPAAKLVSGSATQGTASQVQFVDVTDTFLPPGLVWLALVASSATNTTLFQSAATVSTAAEAAVQYEQFSASPLPATATPDESSGTSFWLFGFATTASP